MSETYPVGATIGSLARTPDGTLWVGLFQEGPGAKVLADQGPEGHFGLRGMPERAAQIGGKVAVWSEVGAGTEVELQLPARIVYAKPGKRPWWARLIGSATPARGGDAS